MSKQPSQQAEPQESAQQSGFASVPLVGQGIKASQTRWHFDDDVPDRFDEHVRRSVPFYDQGHHLVVQLADFFVGSNSLIYEFGCSTGTLTRALAQRIADQDARIVAVDLAPEMVELARQRCQGFDHVRVEVGDLVELELQPTDLVIAYYTIQFVRPCFRQMLFDRIYAALNWGGALLMFEKVRAPDARFQDQMTQLYTDFKIQQGFNEAEILAKTRSLKGVLEPFSTQGNLDLMRRAGFVDVMTVYKYICFEGFLAIK
ncbi:MAG: methyltransferase domain-containing protein [Thiohalocapsa sp. PB-PSB1]|jgi:tRNA (cmo5U34)-methyltransferase|nr:MAG: hypothetical protein N838_03950 [Thiohalocapsa sp. PB-PSB1]QQO52031.1 MAG: methyltransferase domain-containing protein [Thiohalocapsa sp. PB-PSB1]